MPLCSTNTLYIPKFLLKTSFCKDIYNKYLCKGISFNPSFLCIFKQKHIKVLWKIALSAMTQWNDVLKILIHSGHVMSKRLKQGNWHTRSLLQCAQQRLSSLCQQTCHHANKWEIYIHPSIEHGCWRSELKG